MKKGFTLVELLAVIIILAIVMIITIPRVLDAIKDAKESAFYTDMVGIYKSMEKQVNEAQLDLNTVLSDSAAFSTSCPATYWANSKPDCTYTYSSTTGLSSLEVKVIWDVDSEFDYVIYDGVDFENIVIGE